jgi:anti-sigma B factor antagonist
MPKFDPSQHLTMNREDRDGVAVFNLHGECDMHTAPYARLEITPVLSEGGRVVVNLQDVAFMDSAGYGMLVGLARIARENDAGLAVAAPPSGIVLSGLRVLKVDKVLPVATSVDEAVQATNQPLPNPSIEV